MKTATLDRFLDRNSSNIYSFFLLPSIRFSRKYLENVNLEIKIFYKNIKYWAMKGKCLELLVHLVTGIVEVMNICLDIFFGILLCQSY